MKKPEKHRKKEEENILVYSRLENSVYDRLIEDGEIHSKREYVAKKYGEVKDIFLCIYDWFSEKAEKYVNKEKDNYPYWVYTDINQISSEGDGRLLTLEIPVGEIILFPYKDWTSVLNFDLISEDQKEISKFREEIKNMNIRNKQDILITSFYPGQKKKLLESFENLFRIQKEITEGKFEPSDVIAESGLMGAVFHIKKEWITDIDNENSNGLQKNSMDSALNYR